MGKRLLAGLKPFRNTTVALVFEDGGLSQSRKLSFSEEVKPHLAAC
jgi:hypothetical protein